MLNFGTFNLRGIIKITHNDDSQSLNLSTVTDDLHRYNIYVLAVQETHFKEEEYSQNEKGYTGYFVNEAGSTKHGACILIKEHFRPTFKRISARVCTATFKLDNRRTFY